MLDPSQTDAMEEARIEAQQDCVQALTTALAHAMEGSMCAVSVNWLDAHWVAPVTPEGGISEKRMLVPTSDGIDAGMSTEFASSLIGVMTSAAEDILSRDP